MPSPSAFAILLWGRIANVGAGVMRARAIVWDLYKLVAGALIAWTLAQPS